MLKAFHDEVTAKKSLQVDDLQGFEDGAPGEIVPGVLPGTLSADLRSAYRAALARVQIRNAQGCASAAKHKDVPVRRPGERPPGEFGVLILTPHGHP